MKKLSLTLIFACSLICSHAQIAQFTPESKPFQTFLNNTLYVVKTSYPELDEKIKQAFEQYWTVTKFEMVDGWTINDAISDHNKSFFFPLYSTVTTGSSSKTKFWFSILNGGKKTFDDYRDNDVIILSPIGMDSGEEEADGATYRIDYIIKSMHDTALRGKNKAFKGKFMESMESINAQFPELIKQKTLVINKDAHAFFFDEDKGQITSEKAFSKYPYKYEFVSDSEFKQIMQGNDGNYLCLVPVIEANKHILVYDPATRLTVYYGMAMMGITVKAGDIKSMLEGKP